MDRVDAPEIVGVERILPSRPCGRLLPDMLLQHRHHLIEHMHDGHAQLGAGHVQLVADRLVDQTGQHRSRLGLEPIQHTVELKARADQAPPMRDDRQVLELNGRRSHDRVKGLAGGVGDEMEVEPMCGHVGTISGLAGVRERR
jgi:hypothetical protein